MINVDVKGEKHEDNEIKKNTLYKHVDMNNVYAYVKDCDSVYHDKVYYKLIYTVSCEILNASNDVDEFLGNYRITDDEITITIKNGD